MKKKKEKASSPPIIENPDISEEIMDKSDESDSENAPTLTDPFQDSFSSGRKFGKYVLLDKLGKGGMGAVYKAYHPALKSYFALKILTANAGKEGILRFEREARVAFKLKHPNIVQVHDVGMQDGHHYIAMDYIEGKDIGKSIREKGYWPRRAFDIILIVARALQYSHEQGIIHRDIKPQNILIVEKEGKEIPYIVDFGLASVVQEEGLTRSGEIMGTPQYMSPEQAKGEKHMDARSDIYSLGTVLYEMLSGKPMIESSHAMAVLYKVVYEDPKLISKYVPGIAKDSEAITMKCLEKEPQRRYQTAEELAEDIERYFRGEAVRARIPGPFSRIVRKAKRSWKVWTLTAGLIILATGFAILWRLSVPDPLQIKISSLNEQARNLEYQGSLKEAGNIYLSILKLKENNPEAISSLARVKEKMDNKAQKYEKEGNLKEAKKVYEDIYEIDKYYKVANEGISRIANKIEEELHEEKKKRERREKARKPYDRAIEVFWNPNLNEAEIKQCKKSFEDAIKIDHTFADAYFQAGRASHRLFDITTAIEYYNKSLKDSTLTAPRYYLTALRLSLIVETDSKTKGVEDLINFLDTIFNDIWHKKINDENITSDPYYILSKARLLWVKLFILRNNDKERYQNVLEECMADCNKVIKSAPTFADAYFVRAQLNSYLVEIRQSTVYNIDITKKPIDIEYALEDCTQGIYLDPFRMDFYSLRGSIYQSIGAHDLAEKDYTKALLLKNVHKAGFYRKRALCYMAMGRFDLALDDLNQNLTLLQRADKLDPLESQPDTKKRMERGASFILQACLKAYLKDKKGAEDWLKEYISYSQERDFASSSIGEMYNFWKAIGYIMIDEKTDRIEDALRPFLKANDKYFRGISQFVSVFSRQGPSDHFAQDITLFIQTSQNLFCVHPEIKKSRQKVLEFLSKFTNFAKTLGLDTFFSRSEEVLSVLVPPFFDFLHRDSVGKEKLSSLNSIFKKEYPHITFEFFLYFLYYISEEININHKLLVLKELPTASLYYRRALKYYMYGKYEQSRQDLEAALEFEPNSMETHYGLSNVYSLLAEKDPSLRKLALHHLKRAVETGWSHLEDYTMKDEEFKSLGLGKEVSLDELGSWEKKRREHEERIKDFRMNIEELMSRGKIIESLKLLYNCEFPSQLRDLLYTVEKKGMEYFKSVEKSDESEMERKIESLLGERGKIMWEWARRDR